MFRDLKHAARITARRPGAAIVIAVLALGIGANTAIFGVVNGLIMIQIAREIEADLARRLNVCCDL